MADYVSLSLLNLLEVKQQLRHEEPNGAETCLKVPKGECFQHQSSDVAQDPTERLQCEPEQSLTCYLWQLRPLNFECERRGCTK